MFFHLQSFVNTPHFLFTTCQVNNLKNLKCWLPITAQKQSPRRLSTKIWFAGNYHAVVQDRALFRRISKQWKVCWCHQVQLLLTPSRQNLLMVAWGQAVKIAYTMSPCLFWQDFFPWLLWLGFFQALTQGLFPFLSLRIFSQTIMMNTCNWNKNIQDVYAITTPYILWRKTLQKSFVLIHHNWLLKIWWLKKFSSEKCFCK